MSSFAQPQPNSALDKGVRLIGYAAIIYVIYSNRSYFQLLWRDIYSPKDHPKKKL